MDSTHATVTVAIIMSRDADIMDIMAIMATCIIALQCEDIIMSARIL
jgi:hypothetical protein